MNTTITATELEFLKTPELVELFARLEPPSVTEMQGEYAAHLLAQPNWLAGVVGRATLDNPLQHWLCKAFRPVDDVSGRGYNTFQQGRRVVQRFPMGTQLAPSRFDGKPAFQLIYRHFHSLCGTVHMVDEVRRAAPGLYLGLGTYGFTDAQRRIPYPFLLTGPQGPYRGDIGRPRKHFHPGSRELPALTM
ncbi:hypothetical protein [Ketobacter alkanivorans]|uniref:Uncharacterized protein n=1 Tax=Ketobacter alkanivorans TaxID=1917421 RepID=A0A2K9LLW7_9GAMM|nr:hypothetical protein [Ketobacter alkanivorans]AUM13318.1 hypothetical protein Kalk_13180 [Ketobacter alkanivorans]MCP5019993.1 hypothetical protein [Ketobacter sp.]